MGTTSETFTNWLRLEPVTAGSSPAGQCTTSGTWTPPSWVFCLYQRNGVLPHWAHPHG